MKEKQNKNKKSKSTKKWIRKIKFLQLSCMQRDSH